MTFLKQMLAATLVAGLAATPTMAEEEVTIGAELALTGIYSFAGASSRDGMEIAREEEERNRTLGDKKIRLVIQDTASEKAQAITLMHQFAQREKAVAVLGPTSTGEALAIAPIANDLQVPIVTTNALSEAITEAGPWAFKTPAGPAFISREIARHGVEKLKVKRLILIASRENEAQMLQKNVVLDYMKENGVEVIADETVLNSDSDFLALVTKFVSLKPDAIFSALAAEQSANFIIQLRQAGVDPSVQILGNVNMGSDRFTAVGGAAVEGATFSTDYLFASKTPGNEAFVSAFQAKYNRMPDYSAALGYEAFRITVKALKEAGTAERSKLRDALATERQQPTILGNGTYVVDAKRNPSYGAVLVTVKDGQFTPIE